jgi:hypothetical protein
VPQDVPVTDRPAHDDAAEPHALVPALRRAAPALPPAVESTVDVAVGAAVTVARPVVGVTLALGRAAEPFLRDTVQLLAHPPLVPERLTLGHLADRLGARGRVVRRAAGGDAAEVGGQVLDVAVPTVLDPVLDRIDLTTLVISRVDLARLVAAVLDRMDLTQVVLERVDLDPIVTKVLDGMDLTQVVLDRVDLGSVVESALDTLDLTELVRSRVDLKSIAEEVIDEVDLPEIIRGSTTGVATDVVDGGRMVAINGDEVVNRIVDRVLLRRKARRTAAAGWTGTDDDAARSVSELLTGGKPGEGVADAEPHGAADPAPEPTAGDQASGTQAEEA